MFAVVAGHQCRCTAAGAVRKRAARRFGEARIGRQTQIVIAAEVDAVAAIDADLRTVTTVDDTPHAVQIGAANALQAGAQMRRQWQRRNARIVSRHDRLSYGRSEEHTSELQSLMRISYAVFCLNTNTKHTWK